MTTDRDYESALRAIMAVPSQHDLMRSAPQRAMYEIARRAIEDSASSTPPRQRGQDVEFARVACLQAPMGGSPECSLPYGHKGPHSWAGNPADDAAARVGMKPLVYIAGPYTKPDPCQNTHDAIAVANTLIDVCVPLIPHLAHFWHTMTPHPYEFWTEMDFVYLSRCDALLRLPGESPGADAEIVKAIEWGIPVFHAEPALHDWLTEVARTNLYRIEEERWISSRP